MEFILLIAGIITLVLGYFFLGILVKFFVAWWILILGSPLLLVIGFYLGWGGAILAILGLFLLMSANNKWHDHDLYLNLERKIDKAFYLSDT